MMNSVLLNAAIDNRLQNQFIRQIDKLDIISAKSATHLPARIFKIETKLLRSKSPTLFLRTNSHGRHLIGFFFSCQNNTTLTG